MAAKRKICVVITARPSYSRVKTAMQAIKDHNDLELQLVVCASALLDRYGSVINTIKEDGFKIDSRVFMVLEGENPASMAKTTGLGILELATVFNNLQPDAVVVVADRFETIAVSIAAAYQNIPLVHIQGGEVTGNIDEKVRHANTKLADLHLVASEDARERVLRMGENEEAVFNVGCPSIDIARSAISGIDKLPFDPYETYGGVGAKPDYHNGYIVVMQHPVTTEYAQSRAHIEETLYAVKDLALPTFWFWPNVDSGADGTSTGIRSFREKYPLKHVHFFKHMEPEHFLQLLYCSAGLVGNSSVGIRESAFIGVPVINIGTRQFRRMRAENVRDTEYDRVVIRKAIEDMTCHGRYAPSTIYGNGDAGKKIADILATAAFHFHKTISY